MNRRRRRRRYFSIFSHQIHALMIILWRQHRFWKFQNKLIGLKTAESDRKSIDINRRSHTHPIFSNKLVSLRRCRIYGFANNNVYQRISISQSWRAIWLILITFSIQFCRFAPTISDSIIFGHNSPYFKFEFYFQIDCYYAMPCRDVCAVHANATNVSLNIGWAFFVCSAARLWCAAHAQSR